MGVAARTFIERYKEQILADWMERAAATPHGAALPRPLLRDHMPQALDDIAASCVEPAAAMRSVDLHALERFGEDFDVPALVGELSLMRVSVRAVARRVSPHLPSEELTEIDIAIDRAISVSVVRFTEQLRETRERAYAKLESLLAASPVGIGFLDPELRYLRINEALAAMNGQPVAAHIGKRVSEVIPVAAPLEPMLREVIVTGNAVHNFELALPATEATQARWYLAHYFPVLSPGGAKLGLGAFVFDVTDRKLVEQALRSEQARLRSIVEHAPAAIWVKDRTGTIVLANQQLAESLGHALEDVLGRRSSDLLPPEVAAAHHHADEQVFVENRAIVVEEVAPSPAGQRTFLSIKFPIPGEPPLVGGIATEITERKHVEEELRVAVRTRDDTLAIVSHDLRNPLSTVQLSATLLMSHLGADHRSRRHLEMIHRSCIRMENLVDDLLDSASIRAGRFQIERKPERIAEVVEEAVELQVALAEEKGIPLIRTLELGDTIVSCDRERILQVLANLCGNALKFCRAGDSITVTGRRVNDSVELTVSDTGPGIEPARLPFLFEAYWSAPEHTSVGSGLGLYIVRGIVEQHGGSIRAESEPGRGATFIVTLPVV